MKQYSPLSTGHGLLGLLYIVNVSHTELEIVIWSTTQNYMYKVFEFIINSIDNNLQVVEGCQYFGEKKCYALVIQTFEDA